jgi:hypothetical protein
MIQDLFNVIEYCGQALVNEFHEELGMNLRQLLFRPYATFLTLNGERVFTSSLYFDVGLSCTNVDTSNKRSCFSGHSFLNTN